MGINTSGKANTNDYNLGRGKVYFADLDANNIPKAYRFLGNAPEFNISVESETVEHRASTDGLARVDKEVTISQTVNLSLTLDEINFDNLALFFAGEAGTHTNPNTTAITGSNNLVIQEQGRWYDIYTQDTGVPTTDSSGKRLYDLGAVSIEGEGAAAAVLGTDFEVDSKMGRVFIIAGSSLLLANQSYDMDIAAAAGLTAVEEVRALSTSSTRGALKFISENPANNDTQTEYQFHQVTLKSEGDFALIGDDFTTIGLTAVAEANETGGGATSPTLTIRSHANA